MYAYIHAYLSTYVYACGNIIEACERFELITLDMRTNFLLFNGPLPASLLDGL